MSQLKSRGDNEPKIKYIHVKKELWSVIDKGLIPTKDDGP